MYITNTTEDVKKLVEELEATSDLTKLKFLVYIFGLLNNNQINDKNESNPDLIENDDMTMLNSEAIGLTTNACTILLQYFAMLYNGMTDSKDAYEDNGNILGINYSKEDKNLASKFEKLKFNEKLDVFSEIIIRYDNETYFNDKTLVLSFDSKLSGYDIALLIGKLKEK